MPILGPQSLNTPSDLAARRELITDDVASLADPDVILETPPEEFLADGFIYGIVQAATDTSVTIEAPLEDSSVVVVVTIDPENTEIFSLYGSSMSQVPSGAEAETMTIAMSADPTDPAGLRVATWININPVYTHGPITDVGDGTISVNGAHGGSTRTLHLNERTRITDAATRNSNADPSCLSVGGYVFYTSLAYTSDPDCVDVVPILIQQTEASGTQSK